MAERRVVTLEPTVGAQGAVLAGDRDDICGSHGVSKSLRVLVALAKRGPRATGATEQPWIPAFAGMTSKADSLLLCSLSRARTRIFVSAAAGGDRLIGAHGRRQDPKTPVEQALMRGLVTA